MERHHFHFTSYDTITVAQKACFIAGGKYCSSPPKQLSHQPLRVQQEDSHFISIYIYTRTHTHTQPFIWHTLVFTQKHCSSRFLCVCSLRTNNVEIKCSVTVQVKVGRYVVQVTLNVLWWLMCCFQQFRNKQPKVARNGYAIMLTKILVSTTVVGYNGLLIRDKERKRLQAGHTISGGPGM